MKGINPAGFSCRQASGRWRRGHHGCFDEGMGGEQISLIVTGPLGKPIHACYGYLEESNTAIIEVTAAAGITLVPESERNPLIATSYGVGEMIKDAVRKGCKNFIIGLGGSVTNDGGIGMLQALGYSFLDKDCWDVGQGAQALGRVAEIHIPATCPELSERHFQLPVVSQKT